MSRDPKRSLVIPSSVKDSSGAYLPQGPAKPPAPSLNAAPDDLDTILRNQLLGLGRLTQAIVNAISLGDIEKETANQLATCIKITMELKAKQKALLDDMSDDELKDLADE